MRTTRNVAKLFHLVSLIYPYGYFIYSISVFKKLYAVHDGYDICGSLCFEVLWLSACELISLTD